MKYLPFIAASLMIGCGLSQEKFETEYIDLSCDKVFECFSAEDIEAAGEFWTLGADAAECSTILNDQAAEAEDAECEYDAAAAQACLDASADLSCDDYLAGNLPADCSKVCGE